MKTPTFARVFKSGGSQAVRLPREFRFEATKVLIHREGGKIVLESPRPKWSDAFLALGGSAPGFPNRGRRRRAEKLPDLD